MGSPRRNHSRDNPLDRLLRLRAEEIDQATLIELLHELQVYQEELSVQNSQLIETQQALEDTRDRYVDLYDFAPIGYMTIAMNGVILEVNLTGALLLRRERSQIVGLPFNGFVVVADRPNFSEHLRKFRREEQTTATVELALNAGTETTYIQLVTRRHGNEHERKPGLLTAFIDITERKRLEQERREAEEARDKLTRDREMARARADAKDHFLAALSHELRTPLTPILATMSDNKLVSLAPEPLLGALRTVRRNLDLEVRLIDDLLDVTRISRDRLVLAKERVDVHEVLSDVVEMLGHEIRQRGVHVTTALEAPMHWVIGDPTRLRQVFWNLLGNALKFSDPGGIVTISSAETDEGLLRVYVSDTGAGMDDRTIAAINERGTADQLPITSSTGLGLGLAICHGVLDAHHGTLRAVSGGRGRGSTFVVEIPVATRLEEWNQNTPSQSSAAEPRRVRRILLVEDHQDSADMLSQLLMFHDYDVSVARSMQEAIAAVDNGHFDLLISDIRLPDGSGLDLIRRVHSNRPIRGIAISGFGTQQDRDRSRQAGYETHLTKPVDFNRLLDAIEPPRD